MKDYVHLTVYLTIDTLNLYFVCLKGVRQAEREAFLEKNFSVESGRNGRFRHETPKVIPQILTCLKYTAFPC